MFEITINHFNIIRNGEKSIRFEFHLKVLETMSTAINLIEV
jgi:hypothetical protein